MMKTCKKPSIQVRFSFIFPLILIRLVLGLMQMPWKNEINMSIFSDFQTKIWFKKLLMSNRIYQLLVNIFLTRS